MANIELPQEVEDLIASGEEVTYVARYAPKLRIKILGKVLKFDSATLKLAGEDVREMERLIRNPDQPHIAQQIMRLDVEKALKISREFQQQARRQSSANKGATTSDTLRSLAQDKLEERDRNLAQGDPEALEKMHEQIADDLQLTESARASGVVTASDAALAAEGFTPDNPPAPVVEESETAPAETVETVTPPATAENSMAALLGKNSNGNG